MAEADDGLDLGRALHHGDREGALVEGGQGVGAEGGELRILGEDAVAEAERAKVSDEVARGHLASISRLSFGLNRSGRKAAMSDSLEQAIRGGMQVQDAARRAALDAGAARLGWKAGFGTAAAMANLGTAGPLVGFLTDATLLPSGSEIDVEGWGKAVLETEVAVRLGADVEAGGSAEDSRVLSTRLPPRSSWSTWPS